MRESGDPVLQRCAQYERAVDVVAGLAWQYFKKDWEDVATRGFHEHPLFRDRIVGKITRLANRRRVARSAQRTVRGWAVLGPSAASRGACAPRGSRPALPGRRCCHLGVL